MLVHAYRACCAKPVGKFLSPFKEFPVEPATCLIQNKPSAGYTYANHGD